MKSAPGRVEGGMNMRICGLSFETPRPGVHIGNALYLLPQLLSYGAVESFAEAHRRYQKAFNPGINDQDLHHLQISIIIRSPLDIKSPPIGIKVQYLEPAQFRQRYPTGPKVILAIWEGERLLDITAAPLGLFLAHAPDVSGYHTVYGHTFCKDTMCFGIRRDRDEPSYVGQTKNGWHSRWKQHLASASAGSPYRFHEALRRFGGENAVFHEIVSCGLSLEEAYIYEEWLVETFALYPKGFNMIPGGHAGIRYLSQFGFSLNNRAWEDRHSTIARLASKCAKDGRPNPLMAALWQDDDYASSIICGNPRNFTKSQVQEIRVLNSLGQSASEIAAKIGCQERRIELLLSGDTYSRVL